jgi:hypothetical protein
MKTEINYWKDLSLNMFLASQGLFICTTVWDFFMTVIIPNSVRSHIFSGISTTLSMILIVSWLLGIFILTGILFTFLLRDEYKPMPVTINIEYSGIILLYSVLGIISLFNPIIVWPVILNYVVNILWAFTLIYFRRAIQLAADMSVNQ